MDKNEYFLWLDNIEGLDYITTVRLIKVFSSSDMLYKLSLDKVKFNNLLIKTNTFIPYRVFLNLTSDKVKEETKQEYLKLLNIFKLEESKNFFIIPFFSKEYPKELINLSNPPKVIYYLGNINLLTSQNKIMVLNSCNNSSYGKYIRQKILSFIEREGVSIILSHKLYTNMNSGVRGLSIKSVDNFNKIIDFLKSNLNSDSKSNNIFFILNAYKGNNIDFQEEDTTKMKLSICLSNYLIVLETDYNTMNLEIINTFLEQGKDIYAVGGNINSSKSYLANKLISEGAYSIMCKADLNFLK